MKKERHKMKEISAKKWCISAIVLLLIPLIGMAVLTYIVDPYFHYHKPLDKISYRLYEQRYINDGISRHFEYNAVVTGNSLVENTKASVFNGLFDAKCVKLPYSGAGFKELWERLDRTLSYNSSVNQVYVVVDFDDIIKEKDYMRYTDCPDYLYDDNPWNDASYLWNKDVFYHGTLYNLMMTIKGTPRTTFDEYSASIEATGAEVVMPYVGYIEKPKHIKAKEYTLEDDKMVIENVEENILRVIQKYPQVQFYLVFSPSSIARWCVYNNKGETAYRLEGGKTAAGLLLQQENVQLYSFLNDYDLICNLNNYSDTIHYTPAMNTFLLEEVAAGNHRLTLDNYEEHIKQAMDFYTTYDYRSLAVSEENLHLKKGK